MVEDSPKKSTASIWPPACPPTMWPRPQPPMISSEITDEGDDRLRRGAPGRVHLADEGRQQALAAGVEHSRACEFTPAISEPSGRGQAGEVGEERQHGDRALRDVMNGIGRVAEVRDVVAEAGHASRRRTAGS